MKQCQVPTCNHWFERADRCPRCGAKYPDKDLRVQVYKGQPIPTVVKVEDE